MKQLTIIFGALLITACAPLANAATQIAYQVAGVDPTPVVCASGASNTQSCLSVVDDNVTILEVGASSNSPGGAPFNNAEQEGATLDITNTGSTTETLKIWIGAQGFTFPTAPPDILYASSLTLTSTTGTGTASLISCADTANGLGTPNFCGGVGSPTLTNPTQSYSGASTPPSDTVFGTITSLASPYSLEQLITISLGAGSNINLITSQVLAPVPEPASIALLGGLIILTGGAIRRKRKPAARG